MPVTGRAFAALQAVQYEMQRNPNIVYSQQGSIGSAARPDGKSINIVNEFGLDRNLARMGQAIDEDWMGGSSIGYAFTGHPAIVVMPSMTILFSIEMIFEQAGKMMHMSGGQIKVPLVYWIGGAGRAAGPAGQHADAGQETQYANLPGAKVVSPHKVYDVKGLMHSAIQDGGLVVFYNYTTEASADIPDEPYTVPIGKAQILQEGTDITIATLPPANLEVEKALPLLKQEGIKAEYFDTRTLKPFDEDTLVKSVTKTKRLLVVSHGHYTSDFASHIVAVAAQYVSGAKFRIIAFPDAPPPGARSMINWMVPDAPKIVDAAKKLLT